MKLTKEEQARYSRHLLLSEVGELGQEKLKAAKVLVIGAGGLGCPIMQYLAAAGVGTIGVIDMDILEESNLQRQVLYGVADVGKNKALAAKARLESLNPFIQVHAYPQILTNKNALSLFQNYDMVLDSSDNFATRYLVNDACVQLNKPLIYGSIFKFEGQLSVFNYNDGPSYRCLFPEPPKPNEVPNCSEVGVLGVLPGIIGCMQANEALKIILGIGEVLSGKLLIYNTLEMQNYLLDIAMNKALVQQTKTRNMETIDYDYFCGFRTEEKNLIKEISAQELLQNIEKYLLVDVRELWEQPRYAALPTINIPLPRLMMMTDQIPKDKEVVIICAKGIRSRIAIEQLEEQLAYDNLINLTGGIAMLEVLL